MVNEKPGDGQNDRLLQQLSFSFNPHRIEVREEDFGPWMITKRGGEIGGKLIP